jgi:hypothetical protein
MQRSVMAVSCIADRAVMVVGEFGRLLTCPVCNTCLRVHFKSRTLIDALEKWRKGVKQ